MRRMTLFLWAALGLTASNAQTVEILAADQILRDPAITEAQRLIGSVVLGHEDGVLHCDSAWRYDNGQVDVFSNIRLNQPPSTVLTADFLVSFLGLATGFWLLAAIKSSVSSPLSANKSSSSSSDIINYPIVQ